MADDTVVKLKRPRKRSTRDLSKRAVRLNKATAAGRFLDRVKRDVVTDLTANGRYRLSRIQAELVEGLCGAAVALRYMTSRFVWARCTSWISLPIARF